MTETVFLRNAGGESVKKAGRTAKVKLQYYPNGGGNVRMKKGLTTLHSLGKANKTKGQREWSEINGVIKTPSLLTENRSGDKEKDECSKGGK